MSHAERIRRYFSACPLLPAPMCSYTDRPFRDLLRLLGAHLIYTEMYCSEAIVRGDPKTWSLMDYRGESGPVAVQIFGSRPDLMAESARIAERWGAHVVDLNLGCPAKKIVRGGCGSALAEDPKSALAIVRAMRRVLRVPFTIKMRWQPDGKSLELARACEGEGVDAVALHARTRAQGYSGVANWDWIARLKDTVNIPVVGNGDVRSVADARRMLARTGCDAVMVGRGMVATRGFSRKPPRRICAKGKSRWKIKSRRTNRKRPPTREKPERRSSRNRLSPKSRKKRSTSPAITSTPLCPPRANRCPVAPNACACCSSTRSSCSATAGPRV
jgi:nifR3 family TIM-barrel protein